MLIAAAAAEDVPALLAIFGLEEGLSRELG
jgi:hypothetical protein